MKVRNHPVLLIVCCPTSVVTGTKKLTFQSPFTESYSEEPKLFTKKCIQAQQHSSEPRENSNKAPAKNKSKFSVFLIMVPPV